MASAFWGEINSDFWKIGIGVKLPELLTVAKNDIHVLVKCLELANEGAGILGRWETHSFSHQEKFNPNLWSYLEYDSHPVVDVVDHLVVLAHHHLVL